MLNQLKSYLKGITDELEMTIQETKRLKELISSYNKILKIENSKEIENLQQKAIKQLENIDTTDLKLKKSLLEKLIALEEKTK